MNHLTDTVKDEGSTMSKPPFVLQALKVVGWEDIQRMTAVTHIQTPLKKAAGEELIFWEDTPVEQVSKAPQGGEGKVIPFTQRAAFKESESLKSLTEPPPPPPKEEHDPNVVSADTVIWQREMAKRSEKSLHKNEAMKGYKKSAEMYVVKTQDEEGKEKIKFASTRGILVNKKQA